MSKEQLQKKIESFDKSWGAVIKLVWNVIFYPVFALLLLFGKSYLNENYTSKAAFEKSLEKLAIERKETLAETKQDLKEIKNKLDSLLVQSAGQGEKVADNSRRLDALERVSEGKH